MAGVELIKAAALLGAGIAAIGGVGAGLGQGIATGYAVEAVSRQPEARHYANIDYRACDYRIISNLCISNSIPINFLKRIRLKNKKIIFGIFRI